MSPAWGASEVDSVWAYAVAGVIALLAVIYLFAAMLYPEKF